MSDKELLTILMVVGFVLFFGIPIFILVRHKMKIKRVWKQFADQNNLNIREGRYPSVSGTIDGRELEIGSGIGRKLSGRADPKAMVEFYGWIKLNDGVPPGFIAGRKGWAQGKGPVRTNSDTFNKKVWADCPDLEAAQAYLTPERIEAIMNLVKYEGYVYGADDSMPAHIGITRSGYKARIEWLEERKNVLLEAAKVLDA